MVATVGKPNFTQKPREVIEKHCRAAVLVGKRSTHADRIRRATKRAGSTVEEAATGAVRRTGSSFRRCAPGKDSFGRDGRSHGLDT
jgi:hypothetical protein